MFTAATHLRGATAPATPLPERRDNRTMESIVRFGEVLAREDRANAADFLAGHCVPVEVAHRVLIERRSRS